MLLRCCGTTPLPFGGGRTDPGALPLAMQHSPHLWSQLQTGAGAAVLVLACHSMEVSAAILAGEPQNSPSRDAVTGMLLEMRGWSCQLVLPLVQGGSAQGASLAGPCASLSHG